MTDSTPQPARRNRLRIALFASLAFNLFFAGLILGGPVFFGGPGARDGGPRPGLDSVPSPRMFIEILGQEDGRRVLRRLRESVPDLHDKFRSIRNSHKAVIAAMQADPYEPEALAKAFESVRAAHYDFASSIQEPLVTILEDIEPEQRQKLAEAFMQRKWRGDRNPREPRDGDEAGPGERDQRPEAPRQEF